MDKLNSFIAKIAIFSLVLAMVGHVQPAQAAALTDMFDTMSNQQDSSGGDANALSDHEIMFETPTGNANNEDIVITMPSDFDGSNDSDGALDESDVTVIIDATPDSNCDNDGDTLTSVSGVPGAGEMQAVFSGTENRILTLTSGTGTAVVDAADEVCVQIGEHGTSGNSQYINPSTTGSFTITLSVGDGADTGSFAVPINDDSDVTVTASVDPSITFDLDDPAADTCADTDDPYSIDFGTLTTADVETSGTTDTVNILCLQVATNADSGANVTVSSLTSGDLSSAGTGATIDSADATMAAGTENWGACVTSVQSGMTGDANWTAGTCAVNGNANDVGDFDGTVQTVLTSSAPLASGSTIMVFSAAISATTEAASDYTNTLTYIATGTF